jgi:hypothetical protein
MALGPDMDLPQLPPRIGTERGARIRQQGCALASDLERRDGESK